MDSNWSVTPLDGHDVTLVTVDLRNPSPVDRRVRVSNRLDGPVLPPKRAGVSESGWDEEGFDGVVPASGRRTLGYACPAPARRPPVSVVDEGRADAEAADSTAVAVRELGDPRPPGDAIPGVEEAEDDGTGDEPPVPTDAEAGVPPAVESWLTAVEARVDRGERLTDASVESATAALGEIDDASELAEQVSADAAALEAVAERAAALAERASVVDVPAEALRRLP
ncbi:DUF7857 domain-containing protein [Haloplanus rubicundus]|uniref:DUF8080 domain-containing protein n=1 Tax=Haloplanus rubicundus TaxID=1547898 RepID=A0A345E914_9EURY|nr:hypothetical protein [Haloplanus rubicundus]AXG08686.1 hypothetical protein DU484_01770 [Haloplanus rubicundus]